MAVGISVQRGQGSPEGTTAPPLMLGGYAALAESAWMGAAQASDVLDPRAWPRPQMGVIACAWSCPGYRGCGSRAC
jgi:hypothetical protein